MPTPARREDFVDAPRQKSQSRQGKREAPGSERGPSPRPRGSPVRGASPPYRSKGRRPRRPSGGNSSVRIALHRSSAVSKPFNRGGPATSDRRESRPPLPRIGRDAQ